MSSRTATSCAYRSASESRQPVIEGLNDRVGHHGVAALFVGLNLSAKEHL